MRLHPMGRKISIEFSLSMTCSVYGYCQFFPFHFFCLLSMTHTAIIAWQHDQRRRSDSVAVSLSFARPLQPLNKPLLYSQLFVFFFIILFSILFKKTIPLFLRLLFLS